MAKRKRKYEMAGVGCVIQGVGLLAPVVLGVTLGAIGLVVGLVVMLALFFVGSAKASHWVCGSCKNPLASKDVTLCPACKQPVE